MAVRLNAKLHARRLRNDFRSCVRSIPPATGCLLFYNPNVSDPSPLFSTIEFLFFYRIGALEGPRHADIEPVTRGCALPRFSLVVFCEHSYPVVYATHVESVSTSKADTRSAPL
jgi:hypothetical protein